MWILALWLNDGSSSCILLRLIRVHFHLYVFKIERVSYIDWPSLFNTLLSKVTGPASHNKRAEASCTLKRIIIPRRDLQHLNGMVRTYESPRIVRSLQFYCLVVSFAGLVASNEKTLLAVILANETMHGKASHWCRVRFETFLLLSNDNYMYWPSLETYRHTRPTGFAWQRLHTQCNVVKINNTVVNSFKILEYMPSSAIIVAHCRTGNIFKLISTRICSSFQKHL